MLFPLRDSIPSRRPALVNWALIAINTAVFYYEFTLPPEHLEALVGRWGVVPLAFHPAEAGAAEIGARVPTLLTSMFLHGGLEHLFGNMLFLWIFGDNIEDRLGHLGYLAFYLVCGVAAALAQVVSNPGSVVPMIGASGAIGGVMGAYFLLFPHSQVQTLVFLVFIVRFVWVPAIVYLAVWFVIQLLEAMAADPSAGGGVAFWAHVGGFLAGVAWVVVMVIVAPRRGRSATV